MFRPVYPHGGKGNESFYKANALKGQVGSELLGGIAGVSVLALLTAFAGMVVAPALANKDFVNFMASIGKGTKDKIMKGRARSAEIDSARAAFYDFYGFAPSF